MEGTAENLGELETALKEATQSQEWREWYARFVPLVRSGRREIFRIVEDDGARGL